MGSTPPGPGQKPKPQPQPCEEPIAADYTILGVEPLAAPDDDIYGEPAKQHGPAPEDL